MKYRRALESGIVVASTRAEHAEQLEELHRAVFPTLAEDQRYRAAHFLRHVEQFPEGQFVALDGDRVVGMTTTILLQFDLANPSHRLAGATAAGWSASHDPKGDWLFGVDLAVHPNYRFRGIARALCAARHDTVKKCALRGQVAVGAPASYGRLATEMSAEEYYRSLVSGEAADPTITAQRKIGFELRAPLPNYLEDPACGNCGILLVLDGVRDVESA
jgi:predicted N-acetyltransferase YhbS